MKGKLNKIDNKWVVEYSEWITKGGKKGVLGGYTRSIKTKTLPLLMDSTTFPKDRREFVIGSRVKFKEVLINPMGREVDPFNLGQNHSGCVWYAKIITTKEEPKFENSIENTINIMDMANSMFGKKEEQKQHLIDMMKGDEELGLYDESREIKPEDIFNDEKREGVKRVIHQHKVLKSLSLVNPAHLQMTSNGHGEFPDGYKLTEKGIQYIIEQLNKE